MAEGALPWSEAKAFLHDIALLLESDDKEALTLSHIRALKSELHQLYTGREADARRIIAELQSRAGRTHAQSDDIIPSIEEVRARLAAIDSRRQALLDEIMRMKAEKDTSSASLHSLTQQMAALRHAAQTLTADHSHTVPRVKHSLSLYASVTGIKWDYDSDAIQGFVAPEGGALRPFYVDPRTATPVQVADTLWQQVAQAHGLVL